MIVYGKNVYSTLQNDMDSIEKVYVLQGLKDAKLLKSIQKSNLKVEYCNRAKLDKIANTTHHMVWQLRSVKLKRIVLSRLYLAQKNQVFLLPWMEYKIHIM